jgi:hypothetical protein
MDGCLQARNKPIEPPAKPEAAPFFLPSAPALGTTSVVPVALTSPDIAEPESGHLRMQGPSLISDVNILEDANRGKQRVSPGQVVRKKEPLAPAWQTSPLLAAFWHGQAGGDYRAVVGWLQNAGAVAIEREVCSVPTEEPFRSVRLCECCRQ